MNDYLLCPPYISSHSKRLFGQKGYHMEALGGVLLLVGVVLSQGPRSVSGGGRGWINAHATFYGGSDASGTMGE
ncbi:hypothetical protein MLD38_024980 [Melastoma candidum]|uniref:Uncharacterized protein n=1 Tax=Melastoma candidum TaxID=119954 RepID=A0ACB9NWU4_9MYRT|nr:hypothetical protein MLD38_024980 [Melastoma candidum]